ncbi:Eukaryotic translation initiation factor 3 subunit I [Smittium mucronatum]|uniref:Eukaryotic translation initiation factor 3 subunit I n=1 Tax=Smittium mucronatum TaxID=133383 RepID=A0A1R0H8B1_9FUNG|nr:Eukaryotic translation initiation factor 3 subunit I [Smittium mucronatum]
MKPILLQGHTRPLTQIKYNREGDLLFTVAKDTTVNVWYSHNGERLGTYNGHMGAIWTVDVSNDSTLLLTGAADNSVILWNVKTGKKLHKWDVDTAVKRVEFSPDNQYMLFVTEKRMGFQDMIYIFKIDHNSEKQSDAPVKVIIPGTSKVTVAAWSFFNKYIVAGHEDGSVTLYDWKETDPEKQVVRTKQVHSATITDLQTSRDKTYLITSSKDKTAQLLDLETLDILKLYQTDTSLNTATIVPDRDFVVLGGGQAASEVTTTSSHQGKFESRFYHEIFEHEVGRVRGHFGPINTVNVSPKGDSFSTGGEDGYVRVHFFDDDYFNFNFEY